MSENQYILFIICLSLLGITTEGYQYNLTGSSEYAVLGRAFTWTCEMYIPANQTVNAVTFFRNGLQCGSIGLVSTTCNMISTDPKYTLGCLSESSYTLTIPAEHMTEYEQGSVWRCKYVGDSRVKSTDVTLKIAIDVYNVSLIPSDLTLTIRIGNQIEIRCVYNSNALPAPTIAWYLGSTDITSRASNNTTSIIITGNRLNNNEVLKCRATNNNRPPLTSTTTLNVEYPPYVLLLARQNTIEHEDLSVTCKAIPGNPNSTTFYWTNLSNPGFKQNFSELRLPHIQRNSSGTYRCTAENTYSNREKGTNSQDMVVNVLYPPLVYQLIQQNIIEGEDLVVICRAAPGNPSTTILFWTNENFLGFRQNTSTLRLPNIQRNSTGTYRCTAVNTYNNVKKGVHSQDMIINVLYPPTLFTLSPQYVIEGDDLFVKCNATPGNPYSTTFFWTKANDPRFRQTGTTLRLPNIQRNSSGTYKCTAENTYGNEQKGTNSQNMVIDVLYKPVVENTIPTIVNETERVELIREIDSNPLSNISWYNGAELLKTQTSVTIANLTIQNASCADTKNFTLSASNIVQRNVTSMVELIVNCKPTIIDDGITIAITKASRRILFSTTVIAYPEPQYNLKYKNGTLNNEMKVNLHKNAMNNFTIFCEQQFIREIASVTYSLEFGNFLGSSTILVHILKQGKPASPIIIEAICAETSARMKWKSSFNGGAVQFFYVVALGEPGQTSISNIVTDKGENQTHQAVVPFLRPSVLYTFYVFAKNRHGVTSSDPLNCTTSNAETQKTSDINHQTWQIVGVVAGVLVVLTFVVVFSYVMHRHYIFTCHIGINKRRNKPTESAEFTEDKSPYTVIMSEQEDESGSSSVLHRRNMEYRK
ncbi:contactin-5-like isoform X2 [Crassostrea virginica]